jgi:hypothetical protein
MAIDDLIDGATPKLTYERALAMLDENPAEEAEETDAPVDEAEEIEEEGQEVEEVEEAEEVAEEEETEEEETEEETPDAFEAAWAEVAEQFTDVIVKTPKDLIEAYALERQSNDAILEVFKAEPAATRIMSALMREVKAGQKPNLISAIRDELGDIEEIPDRDEDPAAYDAYLMEKARREMRREREEEDAKRRQAEIEKAREVAQSQIDAFAKEQGWDQKRLATFKQEIASFFAGDPATGLPKADFARVLYRGMHFEEAVREAEQKGRIQGKTEAHKQQRAKIQKGGDGIKKFSSARVEAKTMTKMSDEERDATELAKQYQRRTNPLAELMD